MATSYTVVAQRPNTQYLGGTQTVAGTSIGFTTKPSNIYAEVFVPQVDYTDGIPKAAILGMVDILEYLAAEQWVVGVAWSQRVNASNLLVDQVTVTVTSTSGNSTGQFTVDVNSLGPQESAPEINALHAELDDVETS